jgi:septal ring factor EnvC (AmiA/AmiB activator)
VTPGARHLALALAVALCGGSAAAAETTPEETIARRETELASLRARIDTAKLEETALRDERDALLADLESADQRIGDLTRRLRDLGQRMRAQQTRLKALAGDQAKARAKLTEERAALARQLRAVFLGGRQDRLQLWLKQEDPATASRLAGYYDYFYARRAAQVAGVREAAAKLDATEAALRAENDELAALQARDAAERTELEGMRDLRRTAVEALAMRLQEQGQTLASLRRDEARLQKLLEDLRLEVERIPADRPRGRPFTERRGQLPWPTAGELKARFGEPRAAAPPWDGVLIAAPAGAEVRAVHRGRVAFAEWLRGFGLLLILDHGDGYMSLYGHNDSLLKETGEWVEAGEPVSVTGASGGTTEVGLYFAIRHRGQALDPAAWCRKVQRNRVG